MYNGGKNGNGTYQTIINYIPPHNCYIELFLGSGAILNFKKPVQFNYGIEIDSGVIDKFNYAAGSMIIEQDAISYLQENWMTAGETVFIYADPPYPLSCIKSKNKLYKNVLTDAQHKILLQTLKKLQCMVMISSYPNKLYDEMLKRWNRVEFQSQTHKGKATEVLYMNYPTPTKLQDYSYLGNDFIDRQRIKRKIQCRVNTLLKLPALERNAIIEAIAQLT